MIEKDDLYFYPLQTKIWSDGNNSLYFLQIRHKLFFFYCKNYCIIKAEKNVGDDRNSGGNEMCDCVT